MCVADFYVTFIFIFIFAEEESSDQEASHIHFFVKLYV
jgi:hypothetical protein